MNKATEALERCKCGSCGEPTPRHGLLVSGNPNAPSLLCFACVFVMILKTAECRCGKDCIGLVAVVTEQNTVVPLAVCPDCIVGVWDGSQVSVMPDGDRTLIPEFGDRVS